MKVLINYLIEGELGRTAWVTRHHEGFKYLVSKVV